MESTLIYTSVGKDPDYLKLLDYFVKSLVYTQRGNVNILIICDTSFYTYVETLLSQFSILNWFILDTPDSVKLMDAVTKRLHVFDFPKIHHFPFVLYVDLDCLFLGDIAQILKHKIYHNKLYGYSENNDFKALWMHPYILTREEDKTVGYYDAEQYNFLQRKGKIPLNSGLFLFRPSDVMEKHFRYLLDFIPNYKGGYWTDQTFMNVYFHLNNVSDFSIFNKNNIIMLSEFKLDDVKPSHILVHFNNPIVGWKPIEKAKYIDAYWNKFLSEHKPILNKCESLDKMINNLIPSQMDINIIGTIHKEIIEQLFDRNPKCIHLTNASEPIAVVKKRYEFYQNVDVLDIPPLTLFNNIKENSTDIVVINHDSFSLSEYFDQVCSKIRKGGIVIGKLMDKSDVTKLSETYKLPNISLIGLSESDMYYTVYKDV